MRANGKSQLQRRSIASMRQEGGGMSNLADELASAMHDMPGAAASLAAEFGLDFDDLIDDGLPTSNSTPAMVSGLDRTPHSSTEVISEWEEEGVLADDLGFLDDDKYGEEGLGSNPFTSPKVGRDPQVELEDALRQTGRVLDALKTVDNGRRIPLETTLQEYLSLVLQTEKTREEQLRELVVLERELGRVNWVDEMLEGLEGMDWPEAGELMESPPPAVPLDTLAEREEEGDMGIKELDQDHLLDDWPQPSSPTTSRRGYRPSSLAQPPPRDIPSSIQAIQQSTHVVVGMLHALSDTLYTSSSMGVSSARQLKGIRAGVVNWRKRDEMEAECLEKVGQYELAEKRRRDKGGERPAEMARRELAEFQETLERYERQWETLKTIRV